MRQTPNSICPTPTNFYPPASRFTCLHFWKRSRPRLAAYTYNMGSKNDAVGFTSPVPGGREAYKGAGGGGNTLTERLVWGAPSGPEPFPRCIIWAVHYPALKATVQWMWWVGTPTCVLIPPSCPHHPIVSSLAHVSSSTCCMFGAHQLVTMCTPKTPL